jgi:hypothetical protein
MKVETVLNRFSYAVYFRTHQAEIIVPAVHGRQHPRRWQVREEATRPHDFDRIGPADL